MIVWLANTPTPQFVGILNRISSECPEFRVLYATTGDRNRGWGGLDLLHPYRTVPSGVKGFCAGLRLGLHPNLNALVSLGYADMFKVGALLGARLRRRRVFTLSDSGVVQDASRSRAKRALKKVVIRSLFSKRTTVWTVSGENAAYWSAYGLTNQARVAFESPVPVAEDASCQAEARRSEWRRDAEFLVLCVSRLQPSKGVDVAVDAVQLLRNRGVPVRLAVVGTGEWYGDPVDADAVEFVGAIPRGDLAAAYLAADALVAPSRSEPYGLVVREALQFGLPVVASTGVPSARWLCDRGWNLVPPGDVEAMAAAVERAVREQGWPPLPPERTEAFYLAQLLGARCRREWFDSADSRGPQGVPPKVADA